MKKLSVFALALSLMAGYAAAGGGDINWTKYDQALALAKRTGKPVVVFSTSANADATKESGGCPS